VKCDEPLRSHDSVRRLRDESERPKNRKYQRAQWEALAPEDCTSSDRKAHRAGRDQTLSVPRTRPGKRAQEGQKSETS